MSKERYAPLPKNPPEGLLESMVIRYDHGLGCEGYYDQPMFGGEGEHRKRYNAAMSIARQLYEEVSGHGFYEWKEE